MEKSYLKRRKVSELLYVSLANLLESLCLMSVLDNGPH